MQRREFAASMIAAGAAAALPQGVPRPQGLPGPPAPNGARDLGAVRTMPLHVNGGRLNAHLKALADFGRNPQGGVSRVAYSEADKASRPYIMQLMSVAQLEVSIDAAGNILGKRAGSDPSLKPILFGSHTDSVPDGGMYDGDVGSMGAIEVAQSLAEQKITTRHPLIVVIWQNEEGGLWGTHAATAALTPAELATVSRSGKTIREGIAFLGGDPDHLERTRMKKREARHWRRRRDRRNPPVERDDRRIPKSRRHDGDGQPPRRAAVGRAIHRGGEPCDHERAGTAGGNRRTDQRDSGHGECDPRESRVHAGDSRPGREEDRFTLRESRSRGEENRRDERDDVHVRAVHEQHTGADISGDSRDGRGVGDGAESDAQDDAERRRA
jgi:hypothetical protein